MQAYMSNQSIKQGNPYREGTQFYAKIITEELDNAVAKYLN